MNQNILTIKKMSQSAQQNAKQQSCIATRMALKAAGASLCMNIEEFECLAPSNVPLCDLSLTFRERLLSSSTHEFYRCVSIAGEH